MAYILLYCQITNNRLYLRSHHEDLPKSLLDLPPVDFDLVVTLCGDAAENCPYFPGGAKIEHHGFDDPPRLAKNAKTEEEALTYYRRVRDEIADFVGNLPQAHPELFSEQA